MAIDIFPTDLLTLAGGSVSHVTTALRDGRVLLLWEGREASLQGQFLDSAGQPVAGSVTLARRGEAELAQVVAIPDGGFVLSWFSHAGKPLRDGDVGYTAANLTYAGEVELVRYDATGVATGVSRRFTAGADTQVTSVSLAAPEGGGFTLVAGVSQEIGAMGYAEAGLVSVALGETFKPLGKPRLLPEAVATGAVDVADMEIVALPGSGSVVVYDVSDETSIPIWDDITAPLHEAYVQVLDANGHALGEPILLGGSYPFEVSGSGAYGGQVIPLEDGGFAAAWKVAYDLPRFQVFNADGRARTAAIELDLGIWESVQDLHFAPLADGSFVLEAGIRAYATSGWDNYTTVRRNLLLRFDAEGREIQPAFGGLGSDEFMSFDLAPLGNGQALLTWTDADRKLQSGVLAPFMGNLVFRGAEEGVLTGTDGDDLLLGRQAQEFSFVDVTLQGLAGDDLLAGGGGDDLLDGGTGADSLFGGGGSDTYILDDAGDHIFEEPADGALDRVFSSVNLDLSDIAVEEAILIGRDDVDLTGGTHTQRLVGNAGHNVLTGGNGIVEQWGVVVGGPEEIRGEDGNDLLIGGTGDTLAGGRGDDILRVLDAREFELVEEGDGGIDTLVISASYNLRNTAIENLVLGLPGELGRTDAFVAGGSAAQNRLTGNAGDNLMLGRQSDDTLNGGAGDDLMAGGVGSDLYMVDSSGDRVLESRSALGEDTVRSGVDFRLAGTHVEHLELTGNARVGRGSSDDNLIIGNARGNILDGLRGNDILVGGTGNDSYLVRGRGDLVVEEAGGGDADQISAFYSYALGAHLERLVLMEVGSINGVGNDLDNVIEGNAQNNVLIGRGGDDVLAGHAGADSFVFDRALGAGNVDRILDFNTNEENEGDRLKLKASLFGDVGAGPLEAGRLVYGIDALDLDARFVFDQGSGTLWFDADGSGRAEQILIAAFERGAFIRASDICARYLKRDSHDLRR